MLSFFYEHIGLAIDFKCLVFLLQLLILKIISNYDITKYMIRIGYITPPITTKITSCVCVQKVKSFDSF